MTPEDRISVHKFTKLVEKCESKEDILNLCEKALKKYRPPKPPKNTMPIIQYEPAPFVSNRPTLKLKAIEKVDMTSIMHTGAGATVEAYIRQNIARSIGNELMKNDLVKISTHIDQHLYQQVFMGTLEVVAP